MKIKVENWWGGALTTYDVTEIRIIVKSDLTHHIDEKGEVTVFTVDEYLYEDDYVILVLKDGTEKKVHRDYLPAIRKKKVY
jgi:hypothetical protein